MVSCELCNRLHCIRRYALCLRICHYLLSARLSTGWKSAVRDARLVLRQLGMLAVLLLCLAVRGCTRLPGRRKRKEQPLGFPRAWDWDQLAECRPCTEEEDEISEEEDIFGPGCCPRPTGRHLPPRNSLSNYTDCGQEGGTERVIGGRVEGGLPWVCALLLADNSWAGCAATLLGCSPAVLVTAAHCVAGRQPGELRVACGGHTVTRGRPSPLEPGEARLQVIEVISHPAYRGSSLAITTAGIKLHRFVNDIAVVRVAGTGVVCRVGEVWPACLPGPAPPRPQAALLAGWGRTSWPAGKFSRQLRQLQLRVRAREKCGVALSPTQLCAGGRERGACQGDSGGGLVVRGGAAGWTLLGVTSWGRGCGLAEYPTVYTQVRPFLPWIAKHLYLDFD